METSTPDRRRQRARAGWEPGGRGRRKIPPELRAEHAASAAPV